MNNLRFATIIHILVLTSKSKIDFEHSGKVLSSDLIASSINVNPVVVRREIQFLKEIGLLDAKKGKEGGCYLVKCPSEIFLGDIYKLINKDNFLGKFNQPNLNCPIGNQMNLELTFIFNSVEDEIIKKLNQSSLKEISDQFKI